MSRQYPYLSDEKKIKNFICETCGQQKEKGFQLEWQVSWFRGEDEFEKICTDCRVKRDTEKKKADEAYMQKMRPIWAKRAKKEQDFWTGMKQKLEAKYTVRYLTEYQWRINDAIDIYPTNRKYHILKTNVRGNYQDMHGFLASHLLPEAKQER